MLRPISLECRVDILTSKQPCEHFLRSHAGRIHLRIGKNKIIRSRTGLPILVRRQYDHSPPSFRRSEFTALKCPVAEQVQGSVAVSGTKRLVHDSSQKPFVMFLGPLVKPFPGLSVHTSSISSELLRR